MNLLATWKICFALLLLGFSPTFAADEFNAVDGPNVRVMRHEDGTRAHFQRSPDSRVLTKRTYSANGILNMLTIYRMDANQNPLSCKIFDGKNNELFKVAYGYHKTTGQLVQENMYDSREVRKHPQTGKEMPVQQIRYLYDAEGKRSAPIVFNLLPGKTFEEVFGVKSSALETNPFKDGEQ
jgi:hypothetical protein